jgi:hypothetical protein
MIRLLVMLAVAAGLCLAGDATGKWSGTIVTESGQAPGYMVLEQKGAVVTGTAGPSAGNQRKIETGIAEGNRVTVEARPGPVLLKFVMQQDGDKLEGEVFEDGQRIGTVTLQRVKE